MNKKEYPQGVQIYTEKTDKFNSSVICFLIRQPALKETATINSLLLRILGNSCYKYNTIQKTNIQLEQLYGASMQYNIIKKGYEQIIEFYIEVYPGMEAEIIELLKEFIFNPNITEKTVTTEKKKLHSFLKNKLNNKKELAVEKCIEAMFKDDSFGVCCDGYITDIKEISINMLKAQYNKLLSTAPIEIMAIGNFDFTLLEQLIPKNRNFTPIKYNTNHKKALNKKITEDTAAVTQTKLCIGLRADINFPQDYFKLMLYNEVLGGNASSMLFSDIREKQGLCYYINSLLYLSAKIIIIQAGIDYKAKDKVIKAVEKLIDNINNNLELSKKQLISYYKAIYDNPLSIMDFYLTQLILDTQFSIEDIISGIEDVKDISKIKCYIDTIYILTGENDGENNNEKIKERSDALCYS